MKNVTPYAHLQAPLQHLEGFILQGQIPPLKRRLLQRVCTDTGDNLSPIRKMHQLETKQFNHKPPVQIQTTNSRIPIKLVDENYIALIDTGSDICTIPEKILLQNDNLRRLPILYFHS